MSPRHMGMDLKLGLVLDTEVKCRPNNFLQLCLIPGKVKDSSRGAIYNSFLTSLSVSKLPFCLKNSTPYQSQWERENIFHYGCGKGQMSAVPASLRARGRQVTWLPCFRSSRQDDIEAGTARTPFWYVCVLGEPGGRESSYRVLQPALEMPVV